MAFKFTILGGLIYVAMTAWLAASACHLRGRGRLGTRLFIYGAAALVAALAVRWAQVGHAPMQSLFEVFLCLGALICPLWLFCRKALGAKGPAVGPFLGLIVLMPAGFVFSAEPRALPPALQSWLFIPHVSAYMLGYIVLMLAAAQAIMQLAVAARAGDEAAVPYELATYRIVKLGFPLLMLGLALGAVWGKLAWGDYWNWDPKELWSLTTLLVYVGYFHFRALYGTKYPLANAVLALAGAGAIIITLLWLNLADRFPGMHAYTT
jgi:ABC-type transport system involved in cytochrome c biogenesis permease subunit